MTRLPEYTPLVRTPRQRVPDFFIVGHHKCGTTALYEMLRRHPQIFMPDRKELRFFSTDERFQPAGAPKTLEDYFALFEPATAGQRAGEASPQYLRSYTAAQAIGEVQPAARIIAILREPASFLRSLHLQFVQDHVETESDLGKAIATEDLRLKGLIDPSATTNVLRYSEHVRYVEQLRRYYAVFPPEQILVLIYDDFRNDNEKTVRRVLRFLEVDDSLPVALAEANPTVRVRSKRIDSLTHALYTGQNPALRVVKNRVKAVTSRRLREDVFQKIQRLIYDDPYPTDGEIMLELRRRFKPEVVATSEYIGRDLVTLWGYDNV
jgi:hypothetical protein